MHCDIETGNMRLATDNEQKIKLWCRGAVAGSGKTIFFDRIFQCFISIQEDAIQLNQNQIDIIHNEIEKMNFRGYSSKDSD